ncbi:hypothetical protein K1719_027786 [Acacia pycnantha]|nr:hypothetical protein K1719_027786 [Acacia pycnantha]
MDSLNNNTSESAPPQPQGPQTEHQISRHVAIPSNDAMNINNNSSQPEVIEVLLCGGDWLRHKYGLKRKLKEPSEQEMIILKP